MRNVRWEKIGFVQSEFVMIRSNAFIVYLLVRKNVLRFRQVTSVCIYIFCAHIGCKSGMRNIYVRAQ